MNVATLRKALEDYEDYDQVVVRVLRVGYTTDHTGFEVDETSDAGGRVVLLVADQR